MNIKDQIQSILSFFIKTTFLLLAFVLSVLILAPDFDNLRKLETEQNKLLALSFIQNPRVFWKLSENHESKGKIDNAIRDIELAIGLLEMHGANNEIKKIYTDRLIYLQGKIKL
jgi:hypothetical protein